MLVETEESMNHGFCGALPMWVDPILEVLTTWCYTRINDALLFLIS
jgi:hypothetical protein